MHRLSIFVVIAAVAIGATISLPALAQNSMAGPQDAELKAMLQKKNVYTKLYNETLSFDSSWGRYASWWSMILFRKPVSLFGIML